MNKTISTEQVIGTVNGSFTFTPKNQDIKSVTLLIRRWFERVNGNTYFSARIYVDNILIHRIPYEYGYCSHGEYVAREWVIKNFDCFDKDQRWEWVSTWDSFGIKYLTDTVDVQRKGDL